MTDVSQGEGWWQASDTKWYPPHLKPEPVLLPPPPQDEVPSDHEAAPIEVPSVTVAASAPISTLSNAQAQSPTLSPTTPRRWRRSKALWAGAAVAVVAAVVIAAVALVPSHNGANTSAKASNASSLATWSTGRKVLNVPLGGGSVSCPTADFCMAVGGDDAYIYTGGTWSSGERIDDNTHAPLFSVSCPTENFCVAVDDVGYEFTY